MAVGIWGQLITNVAQLNWATFVIDWPQNGYVIGDVILKRLRYFYNVNTYTISDQCSWVIENTHG